VRRTPMAKYKQAFVLVLFVLIIAGPVLYFQIPQHLVTPDIQYVKGKVLWILEGELFSDPVTGFPNFHPPYYHLFLSMFVRLGLAIDYILLAISVVNVGLLILFSYLTLKRVFDEKTALFTVLLIPFINQYMGPNYLFLASSFSFSIPFYLAGLWLYIRGSSSKPQTMAAAALWGVAFLVSPGYLFLIGLIFIYELVVRRNYLQFALMSLVFIIMCIPFLIQANMIQNFSMFGTSAFAWWRGWPDSEWLQSLMTHILSPTKGEISQWQNIIAGLLLVFGLWSIIRSRSIHAFAVIAAVAYLLTYYHFNPQYASRILFFLTLFLAAYAIQLILELKKRQVYAYLFITLLVLLSTGDHVNRTIQFYSKRIDFYGSYKNTASTIVGHLEKYVKPGEFILASDKTYRYYILPFMPNHGLLAYRTGEYFQLNSKLASEMLADFKDLMFSTDDEILNHFCHKYRINIVIVMTPDLKLPACRKIRSEWDALYQDELFSIHRRPGK
jgi:hypothetical protein